MGKICFPLRKLELSTHWEFCAYHRSFGIRKGHKDLYQLFDVLPKQTCEMKALQVNKFTFNNDLMMNRELNFSVIWKWLICWLVTLFLRVSYWGQVIEINFYLIKLLKILSFPAESSVMQMYCHTGTYFWEKKIWKVHKHLI